jgi:chemotaxis signal transduction protein
VTDPARVLAERAARLARPSVADTTPIQVNDYVTFEIGAVNYALEASYVVEVFAPHELSYLPGIPAPAVGVTPWRGALLYLLRLGERAALEGKPARTLRVIVLGSAETAVGLLVDQVGTLAPIPDQEIHALPANSGAPPFTRGITTDGTLVWDGVRFLNLFG